MGDEPYKLRDLTTGQEKKHSYGFSDKGAATYPNGEVYEGKFEDGVRRIERRIMKYDWEIIIFQK